MVKSNDTQYFKKLLMEFIGEPDPMYSMLEWITQKMMELESESKVGALKGQHPSERNTELYS
ncbi:MAG: hypothetical protein NTX88_06150 [Candidatus Atribacteria bacterium]|nr:hypothetical protein [Candidatus Atribacteria bacterium]